MTLSDRIRKAAYGDDPMMASWAAHDAGLGDWSAHIEFSLYACRRSFVVRRMFLLFCAEALED